MKTEVRPMMTHSVILSHGRRVILHKPCKSSKEAVKICETWRKYVVDGVDIEITITNDLELVDQILKFTEEPNPLAR